MTCDVIDITGRYRRPRALPTGSEYQILFLRDMTVAELLHALRGTRLAVSTHPVTGALIVHRLPTLPPGAA